MNGPHDMGGMQCYGPVQPEADEPVFHGEWEKQALALTVAAGFTGMWNIDASRFMRESLPPVQYLSSSYYQIWIAALENLLVERGMVTQDEINEGRALQPAINVKQVLDGKGMAKALATGGPSEREAQGEAAFVVGDRVVTSTANPAGHTRLPRYARGKTGQVVFVNGAHVFPDSNSAFEGENPKWLYTVEFSASELFGPDAGANDTVCIDCWEPYLGKT